MVASLIRCLLPVVRFTDNRQRRTENGKLIKMTNLTTWVSVTADADFSIYNLPFGIFSTATLSPRIGVAIGSEIVDISKAADVGVFDGLDLDKMTLTQKYLNDFIAQGKAITNAVRLQLQASLCDANSPLKGTLIPQSEATMHMPVKVGDYTDFYSSIEHATNLGKMFRDPDNALLPNWLHLPVGYHGRASSIVVSGTPLHRPKGQVMPKGADMSVYQPSARLDFELEMAFIIGKSSELGQPISTQNALDHIFGMVIFNDWSARDIQKWEYVPLGPFLGKNFGSSISPWVVTMEALEPYRVPPPPRIKPILPYLESDGKSNYDVNLQVLIQPEDSEATVVSNSNYKYMYWDMAQQLAHHTVNGCDVNIGDMMASGTISGKDENSYGSMIEISQGGKKSVTLKDGSTRKFIEDGDTVIMRAYSEKDGRRVGFGEVRGMILPSKM